MIQHASTEQHERIASGVGMTNAWLAAQGVLSLKTLWAELAHLRPTAVCGPARTVVWGERSAMAVLTRFICRLDDHERRRLSALRCDRLPNGWHPMPLCLPNLG